MFMSNFRLAQRPGFQESLNVSGGLKLNITHSPVWGCICGKLIAFTIKGCSRNVCEGGGSRQNILTLTPTHQKENYIFICNTIENYAGLKLN